MGLKTFFGTNGEGDGLESQRLPSSENEMWKVRKEHTEMVVTVHIIFNANMQGVLLLTDL